MAVDPLHQEQVYCGTFDQGLWQSADAGASWGPVGDGIAHEKVMSVAISGTDQVGGYGVVYAGTEPSAIFRSADAGSTWEELPIPWPTDTWLGRAHALVAVQE